MAREPVSLNVYDMYWLNDYASTIGVGVYHTGIEVYGVEYAYGGHPFAFSGIFENTPKDAEELGENFKFRESILIGNTDFTVTDVKHLIQMMGHEYRGDKYHLISKNCNHFTAALAKTLTGQDIPAWINRLATISSSIPFLERCLPQEWLTPVALQHSIEERRRSGDFTSAVIERSHNTTRRSSLPVSGSIGQQAGMSFELVSEDCACGRLICRMLVRIAESQLTNGITTNHSGSSSVLETKTARSTSPAPHISRWWNSIKTLASDTVSQALSETQRTSSTSSSPRSEK